MRIYVMDGPAGKEYLQAHDHRFIEARLREEHPGVDTSTYTWDMLGTIRLWESNAPASQSTDRETPIALAHREAVASGFTLEYLKGRSRDREVSRCRQRIAWMLRTKLDCSYQVIARVLGFADHTVALRAVQAHQKTITLEAA
jgi:hypothetical protein